MSTPHHSPHASAHASSPSSSLASSLASSLSSPSAAGAPSHPPNHNQSTAGSVPLPPPEPRMTGLAGWLDFDPLAPFAAVFPLMIMAGSLNTPVPSLIILSITLPLMIILRPRHGLPLALALSTLCVVLSWSMAHNLPLSRVGQSETLVTLMGHEYQVNQVFVGAKLGSKIAAVISLAAVSGMLANPADLMRALVQHLRLPYRVPYAGIVALSFLSRFTDEHRAIREAHALRGSRLRSPLLSVPARWVSSAPALTAAAVRHAERVSMAMDGRAFATFSTRTEPRVLTWRMRDTLLILSSLAALAGMYYAFSDAGFIIHEG